ncbi:hypothetical protein HAX54_012208, partial [Datura stramonium]|nr:hypothetical protein [Datura stramonium]
TLRVPFIDAIKMISGFAKYTKMFLLGVSGDSEELVPVTHYVRAIITGTSVEKKGDP